MYNNENNYPEDDIEHETIEAEPLTQKDISNSVTIDPVSTDVEWTIVPVQKWNGGLCHCFDNIFPSLLGSFLCSRIYASYLYGKITKNQFRMNISIIVMYGLILMGYLSYSYDKNVSTVLIFSSNIFFLSLVNYIRSYTRKIKNIPGSNCEDTFISIFCTPCALSQTGRTLMNNDKICDC